MPARDEVPASSVSAARLSKPLLRWAGGKRWLVPQVEQLIAGREYGAFHEPFAGGAAMFFGLAPSEALPSLRHQ